MRNHRWAFIGVVAALWVLPMEMVQGSGDFYMGDDDHPKMSPFDEKQNIDYLIARGGRAYDNWGALLTEEKRMALGIRGNHPAYPATGKQKGISTWRCKECHGWDYLGRDGMYAQGSHATGIKGIRGMAGGDVEAVKKVLRDANHQYSPAMIDDATLGDLALFVTRGQVDMAQIIDPATGRGKGDAAKGAPIYQTICAFCHGVDGRRINFAASPEEEYLGTVAQENPWELVHKMLNGQPGERMVTVRAFSVQQQADLVSYLKTLPVK